MYAVLCATPCASVSAKRTLISVWKWKPFTRKTLRMAISLEELQLASRNHGMPLEALRYDTTPVGLHYLLIHYDIPDIDPSGWRLRLGGSVVNPLTLDLDTIRAQPRRTISAVMECAGNGRARL